MPVPFEVRWRHDDGRFEEAGLGRLPLAEVACGLPVREFRWYRGRRHYSGWYFSSTMRQHVVYESRLELARIMLADQDPDVVAIAAQPFRMAGPDGDRVRRHVPDLLLASSSGAFCVVDVKAASRLEDPAVVAQFEWTRQVLAEYGVGFEVWSGADPVLLDNMRFLAGYRREQVVEASLAPEVLATADLGASIGEIEHRLSGEGREGLVRPVVLHLLWCGALVADLSVPLSRDTVVRPGGVGRERTEP
jgi:hypothetical protein